jgi:hypothetical protein
MSLNGNSRKAMPKRRKQFEVSIINRLGGTPTAHISISVEHGEVEEVARAAERTGKAPPEGHVLSQSVLQETFVVAGNCSSRGKVRGAWGLKGGDASWHSPQIRLQKRWLV